MLLPGDPLWKNILEEVEGLRFRRHLGNLARQFQEGVIRTEATAKETLVFYFWDSSGGTLMLQLGAGRISYTSRYTGGNLPPPPSPAAKKAAPGPNRAAPADAAGEILSVPAVHVKHSRGGGISISR